MAMTISGSVELAEKRAYPLPERDHGGGAQITHGPQRGQRPGAAGCRHRAYSGYRRIWYSPQCHWQARPGGNDNQSLRRGSWSSRKQALMMTELAGGRSQFTFRHGHRKARSNTVNVPGLLRGRSQRLSGWGWLSRVQSRQYRPASAEPASNGCIPGRPAREGGGTVSGNEPEPWMSHPVHSGYPVRFRWFGLAAIARSGPCPRDLPVQYLQVAVNGCGPWLVGW